MARHIHIHVSTKDAGNFEESKHPRADNGQFGKGSGGGAKPAAKTAPAAKKAADPAKMQSTLATINKRLAAGNLTSASKEELTAKRNRIKIEMEKGRLSKSETKEGDVGHEELTKYGKINTNTAAGRSLASGLLKQATTKPSSQAPQAAPTDHSAGAKRAQQEAQKATGPSKQDWSQASKYYSMAHSEASSENPDKGTIREAEAKARYHEARAQGKPIEMPDY